MSDQKLQRKYFDSRIVDRYVHNGLLKKAEYEAHMKNLPDDTENAVWVQLDLHDAEIGDSDVSSDLSSSGEGES
jgi:hypothetical protein